MAKTKLKWGVNNVNSSFSNGWGIDLDIGIRPVVYSPYLGFRYFQINKEVRFDVISIIGEPGHFILEHIEDSFLPPTN